MQNIKCQLFWNDEIQNAKIFMGVFSSIQNAKFFVRWVRAFWFFSFFLPLEDKIQNGEWIPFYQNFCMVFSSILQNDGPKPKIFWVKWRTKHTLNKAKKEIEEKNKGIKGGKDKGIRDISTFFYPLEELFYQTFYQNSIGYRDKSARRAQINKKCGSTVPFWQWF
jgi:hypothetical protein